MENTMKMYITADEVAELLGVSRGYAYKVIRGLNDELKAKGFRVISGKVPRKYFQEKYYGMVVWKKEGMKICRQQETENYGAVSFIIKTGREYAAKRTNEVLRQKEKQINGKETFFSNSRRIWISVLRIL